MSDSFRAPFYLQQHTSKFDRMNFHIFHRFLHRSIFACNVDTEMFQAKKSMQGHSWRGAHQTCKFATQNFELLVQNCSCKHAPTGAKQEANHFGFGSSSSKKARVHHMKCKVEQLLDHPMSSVLSNSQQITWSHFWLSKWHWARLSLSNQVAFQQRQKGQFAAFARHTCTQLQLIVAHFRFSVQKAFKPTESTRCVKTSCRCTSSNMLLVKTTESKKLSHSRSTLCKLASSLTSGEHFSAEQLAQTWTLSNWTVQNRRGTKKWRIIWQKVTFWEMLLFDAIFKRNFGSFQGQFVVKMFFDFVTVKMSAIFLFFQFFCVPGCFVKCGSIVERILAISPICRWYFFAT